MFSACRLLFTVVARDGIHTLVSSLHWGLTTRINRRRDEINSHNDDATMTRICSFFNTSSSFLFLLINSMPHVVMSLSLSFNSSLSSHDVGSTEQCDVDEVSRTVLFACLRHARANSENKLWRFFNVKNAQHTQNFTVKCFFLARADLVLLNCHTTYTWWGG